MVSISSLFYSPQRLSNILGDVSYGSACKDIFFGSCHLNPDLVLHVEQTPNALDCQALCTSFTYCTTFHFSQSGDVCILLSDDDRPYNCFTWGGPTSLPDEENHNMKCADVFFDDFCTCDDIMEEDCIMHTDPEADFSHGATNFIMCSEDCAMDNSPVNVFTRVDGKSSSTLSLLLICSKHL